MDSAVSEIFLDEVAVTGNVWHIDTGAGNTNGRRTLDRTDTELKRH